MRPGHPVVKKAGSLNGSKIFKETLANAAVNHARSGEKLFEADIEGYKSEHCMEQKKAFHRI